MDFFSNNAFALVTTYLTIEVCSIAYFYIMFRKIITKLHGSLIKSLTKTIIIDGVCTGIAIVAPAVALLFIMFQVFGIPWYLKQLKIATEHNEKEEQRLAVVLLSQFKK